MIDKIAYFIETLIKERSNSKFLSTSMTVCDGNPLVTGDVWIYENVPNTTNDKCSINLSYQVTYR